MIRSPVNTKKNFISRFLSDEFGNRGPNWETLTEWKDSGYSGLVHLRNRKAWGPSLYNVDPVAVEANWRLCQKLDPGSWYLAAMAPHDCNVLQGEVANWAGRGIVLYSSDAVGLPMRDALARNGQQTFGLQAVFKLRQALDAGSLDWLYHLLETYPGHTIEFSAFSKPWGTLSGYNTVFWEVRNY